MINELLQIVAPHYCYGCAKTGSLLCSNCKYDIVEDTFGGCIVCERPSSSGICAECKTWYEKAWCVGARTDVLEAIINGMKFERVKDGANVLADLLNSVVPILPEGTIIVPVPTVSRHVRQRGYDHTLAIASRFAKKRKLQIKACVTRVSNDQQRGKDKKTRREQATRSFTCSKLENASVPYLLIDDVTTTGATLEFATKALRDAGAETVWVAVAARQALNK